MALLATLPQVRAEMKIEADDSTADAYILQALSFVSERINNSTRMLYLPKFKQYKFDSIGQGIDDFYLTIDLGRPLLSTTQVLDANGNSLILNTDYTLRPQDSPYWQLQRTKYLFGWIYGIPFIPYNWRNNISVTGVWGYRTNYEWEGWVNTNDSVQDTTVVTGGTGMTATQTTMKINSSSGYDANYNAPRFNVGNFLQVDTEFMVVQAVNSQQLTIQRGVNGSTAAIHLTNVPIFTWSVQPEINRAAMRWAGYLFARRADFENVKSDLTQGKTVIFPTDMPSEVEKILEQTTDWRWMAV